MVAVCRRRWLTARPRWDGEGGGRLEIPSRKAPILGRCAPLFSASTLLFKGVLPLFLSLTNLVTPPSCTSFCHSPFQRQGRGLRGVPRPRATCNRVPHPSALQGGKVPQLTLQPCEAHMRRTCSQVLQPCKGKNRHWGSQLEPAPYSPTRQTGLRLPLRAVP